VIIVTSPTGPARPPVPDPAQGSASPAGVPPLPVRAGPRGRPTGLVIGLAVGLGVLLVPTVGVVATGLVGSGIVRTLAHTGRTSPEGQGQGASSEGQGQGATSAPSDRSGAGDQRSAAALAQVIIKPGTGPLKGWADTSSLGQGLTPGSNLTNICNRPVPAITATESAASYGMWLALSKLMPPGQHVQEFHQGLARVGVRTADTALTQIRESVNACDTYQISPSPNPMEDVDTFTVRADPQTQVGDNSVALYLDDVDISRAGRMDSYSYLVVFRVGDVLAYTSEASGIPLTPTDLALLHGIVQEEVRRLRAA
jgi:hypothetical protein